MEQLIAELKEKIIETLDLIDVTPADFKEDEQLVGGQARHRFHRHTRACHDDRQATTA